MSRDESPLAATLCGALETYTNSGIIPESIKIRSNDHDR